MIQKIKELDEGMEQLVTALDPGEVKEKVEGFRKELATIKEEVDTKKEDDKEVAKANEVLKAIEAKLDKILDVVGKLTPKTQEKKGEGDEALKKELTEKDEAIEQLAALVKDMSEKMVSAEDIKQIVATIR